VTPAAAATLALRGVPTATTAGVEWAFTVVALDPFGNTDTSYRGTVHFTSNDPQAGLPDDYRFAPDDNGAHAFRATLRTAGSRGITAADTLPVSLAATAAVAVTPAAAVTFAVTGFPSATTAGVEWAFTVTALDPFGNTDTNYRGTAHFSSTDPQAGLPADYQFLPGDSGTHTFRATLKTAGSQALTAADTQNPGLLGAEAGIVVSAAAADHFQLDVVGDVLAGVPFDLVLTARDAYGNIDVNYRGTVTFWTSDQDPGVTLPADYTFTGDDAGSHAFAAAFTLVTPGDQVVRALDLANGLSGEGDVTLNPADGGTGS
jgi:hypothetical protein